MTQKVVWFERQAAAHRSSGAHLHHGIHFDVCFCPVIGLFQLRHPFVPPQVLDSLVAVITPHLSLLLRVVDCIALLDMLSGFAATARKAPDSASFTRPRLLANGNTILIHKVHTSSPPVIGATLRHYLLHTVCCHVHMLTYAASLSASDCVFGHMPGCTSHPGVHCCTQGRHPLLEAAASPDNPPQPNDTSLDAHTSCLHIITGPNMVDALAMTCIS